MKKCTRILALLLALVLTLGLAVTAYADGTTTGTGKGSITINNAVEGQTYTIYEILYLESYNAESKAYAYKATDVWKNFINGTDIKDTYVKVDTQGYVTWVEGADAAAFAKLAQAYAAKNTLKNQGTTVAASKTVTFTDLDLGYYLLDSSLGTLCSLDTTNPTVTIEEKNAVPTNEKKVEEDSNETYGKVNDADIGQTVNFKSAVTLQKGSENVTFHDTMSTGLTLTEGSVKVYTDSSMQTELSNDNYTVRGGTEEENKCTFEVSFKQDYLNGLTGATTVYVAYSAVVNENAVVGVDGNPNESKITYGENGQYSSTPSKTTTYTWSFNVLKYGNNEEENGLEGASFTLSRDAEGKEIISLINEGNNVYRVAKENEAGAVTVITTDKTGKFTIKGLDSDTYYLTETEAPKGYNKLADPVTVTIGKDGKVNATTEHPEGVDVIKINNQSGTELPSTGGMGTTIFYVLGGILAVGAAVLLVTKKRMERA